MNCPNCGAVYTGCRCEYCGTLLYKGANLTIKDIFGDIYRDNQGLLHMSHKEVLEITLLGDKERHFIEV